VDTIGAIQTAFYSTLNGDATLAAMVTGVFNDVPDGQVYPFVQLGTATQRPWHTFGGPTVGLGWNTTVTVHVWSRFQGDSEALAILNRVMTLLNYVALSVTGYTTVMCELDQARVLVEQVDKIETRHIPAVFRVRVS
jgi:hypothetical protein